MSQLLLEGARSSKRPIKIWLALARLVSQKAATPKSQPLHLYEMLSQLPRKGVGARVYQTKWESKGIEGCCYCGSRPLQPRLHRAMGPISLVSR